MTAWILAALCITEPAAATTFTPTASVAYSAPLVEGAGVFGSIPLWVGIAAKPLQRELSPFVSVGSELEFVPLRGQPVARWVPSMRVGLALLNDPDDYISQLFPLAEVYLLAGVRLPSLLGPASARLGIGLSVPSFLWLQSEIGSLPYGLLPSMIELVVDVGGPASLRLGYQF